jgi:4-amino-4-deoxy-L-arabinose transferase-like glycosyltransferase
VATAAKAPTAKGCLKGKGMTISPKISLHHVLVIGIAILGLLLRVVDLGSTAYSFDEVNMADLRHMTITQTISKARDHNAATPVDYVISHLAARWLTVDERILRFLPVMYGILSIVVLYWLGRRMFSTRIGLIAAFLLAINPMHIYHSRDLRFYSLGVLLILLTFTTLHRATERNTKTAWAIYCITLAAAFYTTYYTLFIVASYSIFWLIAQLFTQPQPRQRILSFIAATVVSFALFIPWVIYDFVLASYDRTGLGVELSPLMVLISTVYYPLKESHPASTDWVINTPTVIWTVLTWGVTSFYAVVGIVTRKWGDSLVLLSSTLILTLLLITGSVVVSGYMWAPRQYLIITPILMLASAAYTGIFSELVSKRVQIHAGFVYGISVLISGVLLLPAIIDVYSIVKGDTNLRSILQFVDENAQQGDLLVTQDFSYARVYADAVANQLSLAKPLDITNSWEEIEQLLTQYPHVWFVLPPWLSSFNETLDDVGFRQVVTVGSSVLYQWSQENAAR